MPERRRGARAPARAASSAAIRRRRITVTVLFVLATVAMLFAFVYPTRTFLRQRADRADANQRIEVLREQTDRLDRESRRLRDDATVEQVARERYGLVRPGEQPYLPVARDRAAAAAGTGDDAGTSDRPAATDPTDPTGAASTRP